MSEQQTIIQQSEQMDYQFLARDFDLPFWMTQSESEVLSGGRGASIKITLNGQQFVLRRYLRGGLMARLLNDLYLWTGLQQTRPWQEQFVLNYAVKQHIPVPEVCAVMVQKNHFFYRAALISRYIKNQGTLASCINDHDLSQDLWFKLGQLIKRMHQSLIFHADLNANNILVTEQGDFHLIDFDKARIMSSEGDWCENNIQRLQRSLNKIKASQHQNNKVFHFDDHNWESMMDGYQSC